MNDLKLSELKAIILDQADMTDSGFITDIRLTYWINAELSELHDLLIDSFEDYFLAKKIITLAGDTENYALPDDFYKAIKVFYMDGTNRYRLRRFMMEELDQYSNDYYSAYVMAPEVDLCYRVEGNEIYIAPTPSLGGRLELWYIPQLERLVDPNDTVHFQIPIGWEDYVVCGVVARCLAKEESDPTFFLMKKAEIKARIIEMAATRDEGGENRVVDVYRRFDDIGY